MNYSQQILNLAQQNNGIQTVDKIPSFDSGFFFRKSQKFSKSADFEALFWYNESIKKGGAFTYDDTEC